jgi:hypothetical protein
MPALNPLPKSSGWNNTNVNVVLNAVDNNNGSGVNRIEYSSDGNSWATYGGTPIMLSSEGSNNFYYRAIDDAGNVENQYTYDPFGEMFATECTECSETTENPFKFTGQYFDFPMFTGLRFLNVPPKLPPGALPDHPSTHRPVPFVVQACYIR